MSLTQVSRPARADERDATQRICYCGAREGLHRWRDEACPNQRWKPGNGASQWMPTIRFKPRAAAVSAAQP